MAALNEQQKYLLNRLPNKYDYKTPSVPETVEVKRARKVIADFDEKVGKLADESKRKFAKVLSAAREAIYFKPQDEALDILKALESEFPEVVKL
jgi:hypothetical protein